MKRIHVIAISVLLGFIAGLSVPAHANTVNYIGCKAGSEFDNASYSMAQGEGGLVLYRGDLVMPFQFQTISNFENGEQVEYQTSIDNPDVSATINYKSASVEIRVFLKDREIDNFTCVKLGE